MSSFVTPSGGGTGTVTSVGVTAPAAGITSSGGPITNSGAITLALADDLAALEALSSTGYAKRTGTSAWSVGTAVDINSDTTGLLAISRLATQATLTVVGNVSGSTASPIALTATQLTTIPNAFVGDSGSGGTKGLVPAPAAGDAAAGKFLKADGTFAVPTGGGITGSLTSGRVTLSSGASTVTDSADLTFTGQTLTVGTTGAATITSPQALTISSTGTNKSITITPTGTGFVDITNVGLQVPNGSAGTPSIASRSDPDTGIIFDPAGANGCGMATGGLLNWYCDGFAFFFNSTRVRALTNNVTSCGETDTRWTYLYARHVTANVLTVTTNTTLSNVHQIVIVNAAGATTQTLPSGTAAYSVCLNSDVYTIKNRGAGVVTVAATAGTVEVTTITTGQSYTFFSDGTNWYVR